MRGPSTSNGWFYNEATGQFLGVLDQVPPQFSAVHVEGQRAYALARRGQAVELAARPVEVYSVQVTRFAPPDFELEIECGSGTYIRSIGRDLGESKKASSAHESFRRISRPDSQRDRGEHGP